MKKSQLILIASTAAVVATAATITVIAINKKKAAEAAAAAEASDCRLQYFELFVSSPVLVLVFPTAQLSDNLAESAAASALPDAAFAFEADCSE